MERRQAKLGDWFMSILENYEKKNNYTLKQYYKSTNTLAWHGRIYINIGIGENYQTCVVHPYYALYHYIS